MANREELGLIRGARAGAVQAQLALGRRYLFGGCGLPRSLPTALHWLERAARQDCAEASLLIGQHIPIALARASTLTLAPCYARAFDAGALQAGLVLAQLVLAPPAGQAAGAGVDARAGAGSGAGAGAVGASIDAAMRAKAGVALHAAAAAGIEGARRLLAQLAGDNAGDGDGDANVGLGSGGSGGNGARGAGNCINSGAAGGFAGAIGVDAGMGSVGALAPRALASVRRLRAPAPGADSDGDHARFAALEAAWEARAWDDYLRRALPRALALAQAAGPASANTALTPAEALLLSRCARALSEPAALGSASAAPGDAALARQLRELAAHANERDAQMAVGLWFARMRVDGKRTADGPGAANFKKAIRWLTLAGEQGVAAAWYALARIYMKPEFSQRNVGEAQRYLELAAEMGYRDAQHQCGSGAWRARREQAGNDVRAAFWLQKAAAQGCALSASALRKIAPRGGIAPHLDGAGAAGRAFAAHHPLLAARLELAAAFGLNRAEALLIDLKGADRGHCLVVDIRGSYGRSKRRLLLVESAQERQLLDRLGRLFEHVDCGPGGPEGNYRQRLYRLRMLQAGQSAMPSYGLAA